LVPFRARLTLLNDAELDRLLAVPDAGPADGEGHRRLMRMVKTAVAAHLDDRSRHYLAPAALERVPRWLAGLHGLQAESGLFSSGENLASPPDTSFTVNDMALVHRLLRVAGRDDQALADVRESLAQLMTRVTPALLAGGVHTPNHRWEVAAALARLHDCHPDPRVRARAEEWLAEGIDAAPDGLYSERSANYAALVTNPSLIILAEHLDRPELLEVVHHNLHAHAALTDVDGLVETVHSRRQDQGQPFGVALFVLAYRRFAVLAGCAGCTESARLAEEHLGPPAAGALAEVLLRPELGGPLPAVSAAHAVEGRHTFPSAQLVRTRQGRSVATVYGGSDVARAGRVASGLACDPTFLRWRHGDVVLESVRLSRSFFGLGPFRSDGLTIPDPEVPPAGRGSGESDREQVYRLHERVAAAYYQPLDPSLHRSDGSYPLEFEGRFGAAMGFSSRGRDEVELATELVVSTSPDGFSVTAEFTGVATSYAFELAFRPGGVPAGVQPLAAPDAYELVEGFGTYRVGEDLVRFGPGNGSGPDQPAVYDPGEAYTFLRGTDAVGGVRVYVTGRTPGRHTLLVTASRA
jgi:hypothetical protein